MCKFTEEHIHTQDLKTTSAIVGDNIRKVHRNKNSDGYQRRLLSDYSRVDNLVLHGGPKDEMKDDSFVLFLAVAAAYGIVLARSDVSICHPLPSKGTVNRQICKFTNRSTKIKLFLASKRKRFSSRTLGWTNVDEKILDNPVFLTEHLSLETARLLAESKRKVSVAANGPYTHVWCKQGRVLLRCEGD